MPRNPIYPEVENFIILKKRAKLEKVKSDSNKESSTTQTPKRTSTKRKDSPTVKDISGFIREILFKAQLFVNFFILQHPTNLTNDFFDQNFWYTITRVIRGSSDEERPADQNLDVALLASSFVELSATTNGSLFVPENGLKNYGQSLSAACETVVTTYNNYYIENFENIICNYFIYALRTKYLNAKVGCIKNLVKNRISTLPLSKESLNNEPFKILPALRHILEKYDDIYKAQATQKDKTDSMNSLLPRRFGLFPNPTLHWRFIKIDAQNLTGIFPEAKQKKQANESSFDYQQRCFYQMFALKRLDIQNCEKLQALPEQKGKMFLNGLYTDGYTCRVLFARKVLPSPPEDNMCLELNDLSSEESKHRLGIEKIETDIPSPKTAYMEQFVLYITYMSQHMNTLFDFYGFETSKVKWLNYLNFQKAIQESGNILINGGKKYNKDRRKKTKENRKRRKKTRRPRTTLEERVLTTIPKSKRYTLFFCYHKFSKL
ncbi:hypothetical protein MFLAVUS_006689 [Mucor flavus]|uniref:Uncharacterized protein n=1 Tax=Mucor flavus TaxID=439312 RepID=A0ABP9Z275_9FUNG